MLQTGNDLARRERIGAALGNRLADLDSLEARILEIARAGLGPLAFSTSLGLEDQAVLHAIACTGAAVDVFTLDTGRLFAETLETIDCSEQRYGLPIRVVSPDAPDLENLVRSDGVLGFRLTVEARKACCEIRKVRPLRRALTGTAVWITGLRRAQSAGRGTLPFLEWDDQYRLFKANPLADWSLERLEAYIAANDIPINPLHARGFPSIGCQPCTRAIKPGEDLRAGRWWWEHENGKECGLHNPSRPNAETAA